MRKSIIFVSVLSLLLASCGGSGNSGDLALEELIRQALGNPNQACVDKYLSETKAKIGEADELKASGDASGSQRAVDEAIEIFKTEESPFNQQIDSVNAQNSRYDETVARKENIAAHPGVAGSSQWGRISVQVDEHLAKAKEALDNCDPETAASELDSANALLTEMEQLLGAEVTSDSSIYVVKKGDNLWNIAGREYSNPFMWPIIYWTNQQKIKDPDLIFPDQEFEIIYDSTAEEKANAEHLAKTRGPWSLYDNK